MINAVYFVSGWRTGLDTERGQKADVFFFSCVTEPVKNTCKTLSSRLLLSSLLPPRSPLSLYTSSVADLHTHCFCSSFIFCGSPWSADYWTSDLCQDPSFPTCPAQSLFFQLLPSSLPFSTFISVLHPSFALLYSELWAVGWRVYWSGVVLRLPPSHMALSLCGDGREEPKGWQTVCVLSLTSWLLYGLLKYCMQKKDALLYILYHPTIPYNYRTIMWPFFRWNRGGTGDVWIHKRPSRCVIQSVKVFLFFPSAFFCFSAFLKEAGK